MFDFNRFIKLFLTIFLMSMLLISCGEVSIEDTSPVSTSRLVPVEQVSTGLRYPNRYIDWQAEVVCYYLGETAISCLPLSETKIIIGVNRDAK